MKTGVGESGRRGWERVEGGGRRGLKAGEGEGRWLVIRRPLGDVCAWNTDGGRWMAACGCCAVGPPDVTRRPPGPRVNTAAAAAARGREAGSRVMYSGAAAADLIKTRAFLR